MKQDSSLYVLGPEPIMPLLPVVLPVVSSTCFIGAVVCCILCCLRHTARTSSCSGYSQQNFPGIDTTTTTTTQLPLSSRETNQVNQAVLSTGLSFAHTIPGSSRYWCTWSVVLLVASVVLFIASKWLVRDFHQKRETWVWQLSPVDRLSVMHRQGLQSIAGAMKGGIGFQSILRAL